MTAVWRSWQPGLSNLGTIIRERREVLGLTQSRLARSSGLSQQTLVGLEAGPVDGGEERQRSLVQEVLPDAVGHAGQRQRAKG